MRRRRGGRTPLVVRWDYCGRKFMWFVKHLSTAPLSKEIPSPPLKYFRERHTEFFSQFPPPWRKRVSLIGDLGEQYANVDIIPIRGGTQTKTR